MSSEVSARTTISVSRSKQMLFVSLFIFCVILYKAQIEKRLASQNYSPKGYWKEFGAITKLAQTAKVSEDVAKQWLFKQALWQIYLPASRYLPRPKFDVPTLNAVHQADLLILPHDKLPRDCKVYKYALTVVDVASLYKLKKLSL